MSGRAKRVPRRVRRAALASLLAGALLGGSDGTGCRGREALPPGPAGTALLAVGDTGVPQGVVSYAEPQNAVARAMAAVDRAAPVSGIVLLGDNFYPDGLKERAFKDRLRENVVRPYCPFLHLTARGRGSLSDWCREGAAPGRRVSIFAVLGNHDYGERESPRLQRKRIPRYIGNWRMPRGQAERYELPGGVSLILLQSQEIIDGAPTSGLVGEIRRSRGPWRILAAHHPMVDPGRGFQRRYAADVAAAVAEAGVPVQLFLAGHEHNLQVLERAPPGPALHVVSGAGANPRVVRPTPHRRHFGLEALGFARVDLSSESAEPALVVTVYAMDETGPPWARDRAQPVSRWSVSLGGQVTERPLEPSSPPDLSER